MHRLHSTRISQWRKSASDLALLSRGSCKQVVAIRRTESRPHKQHI